MLGKPEVGSPQGRLEGAAVVKGALRRTAHRKKCAHTRGGRRASSRRHCWERDKQPRRRSVRVPMLDLAEPKGTPTGRTLSFRPVHGKPKLRAPEMRSAAQERG